MAEKKTEEQIWQHQRESIILQIKGKIYLI